MQKAINVVFGTLDLGGYNVTIQLADGTYTGAVAVNSPQVGAGAVTIKGNTGTPGNVIINTAVSCIYAANGATLNVQDMQLTSSAASLLWASKGGVISFQNIRCGAGIQQLKAEDGGCVVCTGNYAIVGGGLAHWVLIANGIIRVQSVTITLSGTPAFTAAFCASAYCSTAIVNGNTFSGSATGSRYNADTNAVIYTGLAGASYLPGNAAGTATNGGQYV